jgi:hypothetical protein
MTADEYTARATPRLELMDRIAPRCGFDLWEFQRTAEQQRLWELHAKLLREQMDDEVAAGL